MAGEAAHQEGNWGCPQFGCRKKEMGEGKIRKKKEAKITPVPYGSLLEMLSHLPTKRGISGKGVVMPRAGSSPSIGAKLCIPQSWLLSLTSSPHPQYSSTGMFPPFQPLAAKLTFPSCSSTLFEETSKS